MSTSGTLRYDGYLSNVALSYPTGSLIGTQVAPLIPADNFSDYLFVDADDAIEQMNDYAEDTAANEVDFTTGDAYSYRSFRYALSGTISDKKLKNASKSKVVRLEQRETNKLVHRLRLKHEVRVAAIMKNTAKVTNFTNVNSVVNACLNETAPTLEADIVTAVNSIYNKTGAKANTIVIPFEAATYAAKIAFIKDIVKYIHGLEYVQGKLPGAVHALVGLPPFIKGLRVVIADGRKNDADKGETASKSNIWGDDILIGYVPQNSYVDDMLGIATMEHEQLRVSKERKTDPRGTRIVVEWDYDIVEANLDCWYLLQDVIA